jgi:DNA primase
LLGEDLELRELQKKGKIGRIDATCETEESKTHGIVEIPTSIDKAETTIIAAAVETIDRVGPCSAKFEVINIEDVRSVKREYVMERARKLLEKLNATAPEFREMGRDVVSKARTSKIVSYGNEMLPAGPDIESNDEIIVVEGRADVVNLLRYGIKNTIAMNGTVIPKTVKDLSREKETTLFVDGDRGGILIIKDAIKNAKISYITKAPDGKEVEELTEKEVLSCLRNKKEVDEFLKKNKIKPERGTARITSTRRTSAQSKTLSSTRTKPTEETEEEREFFQQVLEELTGTRGAALIVKTKEGLKTIYKASSSKIIDSLYNFKRKHDNLYALVIDDTATTPIIKTAERLNCSFLIARNFANIKTNIKLISL